jgi:hypothetical protein
LIISAPEEKQVFDELEKSQRNLSERYPEKEPADRAYDATRLVFSLFPNGVATELLSLILTAPVVRRRDEWVVDVASAVDDILKWKESFSLENLHENEQFISALIVATRIATGTHHREKRRMLRNILVKIGTFCDIDENLQFIYLRLVDDLTPTHIKILEFFWRGNSRLAAMNGGTLPQSGFHQTLVDKLLPELKGKSHVDQIVQDLRSHGLCTAQNITAGIGSQVMTNHGIGFLRFILTPKEIA